MRRFLLIAGLATASLCYAQEVAHEPGHRHEEASEPSLALKWANFAILAVLLGWGISKTAPEFLRSRSEEIAKGIADAAKMKADAEAKASEIEQRMANLSTEIESLRAKAKVEMQVEADRIRRETENFIAKIQENALADIESAAKRSIAELKSFSAGQAIDLAEQRIRAELQNGSALVDRFINDLGQPRKGSNN